MATLITGLFNFVPRDFKENIIHVFIKSKARLEVLKIYSIDFMFTSRGEKIVPKHIGFFF